MADPAEGLLAGHRRERLRRIDLGREGDWSATVQPIWAEDRGWLGLAEVPAWHATLRPALELYYDDGWIGMPCGVPERGGWALDVARIERLVTIALGEDPCRPPA